MKIAKLKVGQLRKELEKRNLDFSGTRPVLVKRLKQVLDEEAKMQPLNRPQQNPALPAGSEEKTVSVPSVVPTEPIASEEPPATQENKENGVHETEEEDLVDYEEYEEEEDTPPEPPNVIVNAQPEAVSTEPKPDARPEPAGMTKDAPAPEEPLKPAAAAELSQIADASQEDRLKLRQKRFGILSAPDTTAPVHGTQADLKRRQERFGVVERADKPVEKKGGPLENREGSREGRQARKRVRGDEQQGEGYRSDKRHRGEDRDSSRGRSSSDRRLYSDRGRRSRLGRGGERGLQAQGRNGNGAPRSGYYGGFGSDRSRERRGDRYENGNRGRYVDDRSREQNHSGRKPSREADHKSTEGGNRSSGRDDKHNREELKRQEEVMRKRAEKFGVKKDKVIVPAAEMERRVKRQRRFGN